MEWLGLALGLILLAIMAVAVRGFPAFFALRNVWRQGRPDTVVFERTYAPARSLEAALESAKISAALHLVEGGSATVAVPGLRERVAQEVIARLSQGRSES